MPWVQRPVDAPDKTILSAQEIATLFGYESENSVRTMVERGELPKPLKRGGTNVWDWEDVVLARLLMKLRDRMEPLAPPPKSPKGE